MLQAFESAVEEAYAQKSSLHASQHPQRKARVGDHLAVGLSTAPSALFPADESESHERSASGKERTSLQQMPTEIVEKIFLHCLVSIDAFPGSSSASQQQPLLLRRRTTARGTIGVGVQPAHRTCTSTIASPQHDCPPDQQQHTAAAPPVPRTLSQEIRSGLKDVARVSCTNRYLHSIFRNLLTVRGDLALQVESNIRALQEKRRLVRRLTLTHHGQYMKREVACEIGGGGTVIAVLALACGSSPALCGSFTSTLNFVVFTLTHVCMHSAILAGAYRAAATFGIRRALIVGLLAITAYYCGVVGLVQMLSGITHVPPHLDLEPWGRSLPCSGAACQNKMNSTSSLPASFLTAGALEDGAILPGSTSAPYSDWDATASAAASEPPQPMSSAPNYPLAMLVWPLFGTSMRWKAIHVFSNSFAWCYGVWEFSTAYTYTKSRNGLA